MVALDVQEREREEEMLELFARAVTRYGVPQTLYLDNGSTYRGDHLALVCSRLGIALRHAQPYDPQARGKMERFWRTLREQCLDFISPTATLHDLQVRLHAWLDSTYQHAPHAGLLGATPLRAWHDPASVMRPVDHAVLATALLTTTARKVRNDSTLQLDGITYEVDARMLCGKKVQVTTSPLPHTFPCTPTVTYEGKTWELHVVNAQRNAQRKRDEPAPIPATPTTDFNPANTALRRATKRLAAPKSTP